MPDATALSTLIRALDFAATKHRMQRRKDAEASPYINHPIALAAVLAVEAGIDDPVVLCAAVLHDTVEDTETSFAELDEHFGAAIAAVVAEVTDDKALDKQARKELQVQRAAHSSKAARLVKLADKICNLRDLLAAPPKGWSAERKRAYFDWATRVIDGLRGTHAGLESTFDALCARAAEFD
ncbi:MAG: HD domain-containing protein [Xanthomonadales bacterium]|jgi:guanosine-3',5'-bis(diphosphate) 3'-pyrophosphohydrolase|nr:HD domain-containing protein [Xanthomonadales bacterium]